MSTKSVVTGSLTSVFRAYVRYAPIPSGKEFLFKRILNPYLTWRSYSTVATTTFGAKVAVSLPDLIQSRIYFFGVWEPHLTQFVRDTLSEGDYFVDVGANIGYFSLLASSLVGPRGKVFSVEASPSIFQKLQANIAMNKSANIAAFNMAASDREGTLSIYLGSDHNLGSTTTVASVASNGGQKLEAVIPAGPLPAIIGAENLLKARMIKIDVEGAEPSVIRGIGALLKEFGDETEWVIEISPGWSDQTGDETAELLASFREAGYKLYQLANDYRVGNYILPKAACPLRELENLNAQVDVVATKRR